MCDKNLTENDNSITQRDDGSYRILLQNSPKSNIFTVGLAEILTPLQNQRYVIERKKTDRPADYQRLARG